MIGQKIGDSYPVSTARIEDRSRESGWYSSLEEAEQRYARELGVTLTPRTVLADKLPREQFVQLVWRTRGKICSVCFESVVPRQYRKKCQLQLVLHHILNQTVSRGRSWGAINNVDNLAIRHNLCEGWIHHYFGDGNWPASFRSAEEALTYLCTQAPSPTLAAMFAREYRALISSIQNAEAEARKRDLRLRRRYAPAYQTV